MKCDYIDREVLKETDKAYLCEFEYNNPRDGAGKKARWVAKSLCVPMSEERKSLIEKALNVLPDDLKWIVQKKYVGVPEWIGGNGYWGGGQR